MITNVEIEDALLEAVFITRWNEEKSSMYPLLSIPETQQVINDVIIELDKAGFIIIKK